MGVSTIVCVEVERPNGRLRKWEDTLALMLGTSILRFAGRRR